MTDKNNLYLEYYFDIGRFITNSTDKTFIIKAVEIRKVIHNDLVLHLEEFSEEELEKIQEVDDLISIKSDYAYNFLESLNEPWWTIFVHEKDKYDWIWRAFAIACLATSQIILFDFALSFFKGGGNFSGILIILGQCGFGKLLIDNFRQSNKRIMFKVMNKMRIPSQWEWEIRCAIAIIFLILSIWVNLGVPSLYANQLNEQGADLIRQRQLIEAKAVFELSNSIYPDNSVTLHNLGFIEEYFQNYDQAIEYYRESIDYIYSVNNLAQIYLQKNEPDKAVQLLLFALKNDKHEPIVYHFLYKNLAKARLQQNLPDDAIKYSKLALQQDDRPEVFCLLGDAYKMKKDYPSEIGFRQECLIRTIKRPVLDREKNKAIRRINEIIQEFDSRND